MMDLRIIRTLVEEVLTICREDDTGVTLDLIDVALRAGAELGMSEAELQGILNDEK